MVIALDLANRNKLPIQSQPSYIKILSGLEIYKERVNKKSKKPVKSFPIVEIKVGHKRVKNGWEKLD